MQEADGSDLKHSVKLKQMAEPTGLSTPVTAVDMSDHSLSSAGSASEVPRNRNFTNTIVSKHGEDVSSMHSKVEEHETLATLNLHENEREDDQSDGMIAEPSCQQSNSEVSFVFVGKIHEISSINKSEILSSGTSMLPCRGVCKISLSHLAEIINGLSGEQCSLLLKLRESSSDTVLGTDALISLQYSIPDFSEERLKEELSLANCTKDILNVQLKEHSNLQMGYDCHIHKLGSEISVLHDAVKEAHERGECLTEYLEKCRSDFQTAINERDEFGNQINSLKAEVHEFSARANDFQSQLERSKSQLLILSRESAECRDLVAALRVENKNLNDSLALMTEENKKLAGEKHSCHLEIEKLLKELADCKQSVSVFQESFNAIDDAHSHHISEMQDGGQQDELFEQEVIDKSFASMKRRLEKAEKLSRRLEKEIEEWHHHATSVNKSGDMVAAPAVSRMIQAFESIAHHDENDVEEKVVTKDHEKAVIEEQSPTTDSFILIKEQIRHIRRLLQQLIVDNESATSTFKVEQDIRNSAEMTIESLKEHSENLEATNLELLVLSEAIRQHLSSIKEKNIELEDTCQRLNEQGSSLKAENAVLNAKLQEYELGTEELQCQLINLQKSSDEISSVLRGQLEDFQKKVAERDSKIRHEEDSMFAQILESVDRLNDFIGLHLATDLAGGDGSLDICGRVSSSITAAINLIEELKENKKVTLTSHQETINLLSEVNNKCTELHEKSKLAYETLHRFYNELRDMICEKLVEKLGYNINSEINRLLDMICEALQDPGLKDSVSTGSTDCLKKKLRKLIEDYMHLSVAKSAGGDTGHDGKTGADIVVRDTAVLNSQGCALDDVSVLKKELEDALNELMYVKEDRDRYFEKQQSLVSEVQALEKHKVDLQELLNQEIQKCASVKEKLNVAVRKGKSVVQQRDSLKQTIEEMNVELGHLKSEIKHRDNTQ